MKSKKIKTIIQILASCLFMTACADSLNEIMSDKELSKEALNISDTKKIGDNIYDALGYGYDVTGDYMQYSAIRNTPIINVQAYENDAATTGGIIVGNPGALQYQYNYETSAKTYAERLAVNVGLEASYGAFSGALKVGYQNSSDFAENRSFSSVHILATKKVVSFASGDNSLLKKHLSVNFKNDINNMTANQIIQKYGTHLLTNVELGAKLDYFYSAYTNSSNKKEVIEAGLKASYKSVISINANVDTNYNKELAQKNTGGKVHFRVVGGDPNSFIGSSTMEILPGENPVKTDLNSWLNSIGLNNMQMIGVAKHSMIPLYELISDEAKRQSLKMAIETYRTSNKLEDTPIDKNGYFFRQYFSPNNPSLLYDLVPNLYSSATYNNMFTDNNSTPIVYKNDSIDPNNLVPFYMYLNKQENFYFLSPDITFNNDNYENKGTAFFAYKNPVSGSYPVYEYKMNYNNQNYGICYSFENIAGLKKQLTGNQYELRLDDVPKYSTPKFYAKGDDKRIIPGATYNLVSALNNSSILTQYGLNAANGTQIILYGDYGYNHQKWIIEPVGNGYYKLKSKGAPSMVLDVDWGNSSNGTKIQLWGDNGGNNQKWKITRDDGDYVTLSPECAPSSKLDVSGSNSANDTKIQLWQDNGTNAQKWKLVKQ